MDNREYLMYDLASKDVVTFKVRDIKELKRYGDGRLHTPLVKVTLFTGKVYVFTLDAYKRTVLGGSQHARRN